MVRGGARIEFPELRQLAKDLSEYTGHVQRKYLKAAVRASLAPGVQALKSTTPKGPTGNLRRSIGTKVVFYKRSGAVVGLVGYRVGGSKSTPGAGTVRRGSGLGYHQGFLEFGTRPRQTKGRIASSFNSRGPFIVKKLGARSRGTGRVQTTPKYPKAFLKVAPAGMTVDLKRMPVGGSTGQPPIRTAFNKSLSAIKSLIKTEAARALVNAAKDKFAHYRTPGT
jgi:hypothetical protein